MITCDFTLERDLGNNKKQIFTPDKIPPELPNLVLIEGPNSSGKSTLLNILALSMYGSKSKKINELLKKKMSSLLDSEYQDLSFGVKIENKDMNLKIVSRKEKGSREINVFESVNGEREKPLSPEKFDDKYNLIYDIPNNPTERLRELTREIKEEQLRYGYKVANLHDHIHGILKEIEKGRDPERLESFKANLRQLGKDRNELEEKRNKILTIQETLTTYTYLNYFLKYCNLCRHFAKEIENLQNKSKEIVKVGRKTSGDYKKLEKDIKRLIEEIDEQFQTITPLLNNVLLGTEKSHFIIWNRIHEKLYDTITDYEFPDKFESEAAYLFEALNEMKMREEKNESLKEAKIISELIDFLNEYKNSKIILPGAEISLIDFLKALESKKKQNQKITDRANNISRAIELLEGLDNLRKAVEKKLPQLRNLADTKADYSDNILETDEINSMLSEYKVNLGKNEKMVDFYVRECITKGIEINSISDDEIKARIHGFEINKDLSPYLSYKENELLNKINRLEIEIKETNEDISKKSLYINDYEKEIERLEAKEPHKYQEYADMLKEIYIKTGLIHQYLCKNYDNEIGKLMSDNPKKDLIDKKYLFEISKYLAKRIGTFRHIDKQYKANSVDLISREIVTIEGQIIRFDDMGTGQSQSAYLKGLLNTEDDKRKIIALFDEVAMMDSCSLDPIYKKFKELYDEGRLLVGIVVQKADSVNVIPKI
jgi:DNA repair protein SbcC/Rad50